MHLADAFIQSDLQCIQVIHFFFISTCVPWELNPQPFALLTQCSTTEPQEHLYAFVCTPHAFIPVCMRSGSGMQNPLAKIHWRFLLKSEMIGAPK